MLKLIIFMPFISGLAALLPVRNVFRIQLFAAVSFFHFIAVIILWKDRPPAEINGFLALDAIGLILLSIVSFIFVFVSMYAFGYFRHERRDNRVLVACLLGLLSTMSLVSVSYHLGLLWVAVETTTLFSAPLISFHRNKDSLEATWKYLLVCSVGIALALLGTFFVAIAAYKTKTLLLPALLGDASQLSTNWLKLGVIFLLVGYGCKMGLAPMHSWKPEAYGQSMGMVAVVTAGALTQCSFLALLRVSQICNKAGLHDFFASMLLLTGLFSLAVPALRILGERNLKRVIAYSSVEHMGIMVLGLGLGGPGIFGALWHMVNNALAKAIMFLTAGSMAQKYGSARMDDVQGVIHVYPWTGLFLVCSLLAGTGIFPFATFHSELMILNAAVQSGHYLIVFLSILFLALIFFGVAKVILGLAYGHPTDPVLPGQENAQMNLPISIAVLSLIILGLWMPGSVRNLLNDAVVLLS